MVDAVSSIKIGTEALESLTPYAQGLRNIAFSPDALNTVPSNLLAKSKVPGVGGVFSMFG